MEDLEIGEDSLSSIGAFSSVSQTGSYSDNDSASESDSEEEEAEPKLKYERLSADLKNIFEKDSASVIAVHQKFLVLGTNWGVIHLLDALGNSLAARKAQPHSVKVNQVSIDHAGEFYASCADDGRLVVTGLYTEENTHNLKLEKPVRSVAIDPIYARANSGRRYMTAIEDKLILNEKTFLSRYKQSVLCQGEGPIHNIKWRGRFVSWITSKGVRVYDVVDEKTISLIPKPPTCPPCEHVPWRMGWGDQFKLIVSFGSTVKVCYVEKRVPAVDDLPSHLVRVDGTFTLDCFVCGVAPLDNLVVVLALPKDRDEDGRPERPQMMVFEKGVASPVAAITSSPAANYELVSTDLLTIRGYEAYGPLDYQLECLVDDKHYFIMSPKDIVVGKPRDKDDHIDWLVDHEDFETALAETRKHEKTLRKHTVQEVGRRYLDHLLKEGELDKAGELCTKLLGKDKKGWEEQVFRYAQLKQLRAISKYLPCGDFKLDPAIYEMVLFEFLKTDDEGFLVLVRKWSSDLYNTSAVVNVLMEHLRNHPDNSTLLRSLATLFTYQRKYDKAMEVYLRLKHKDVFHLIRQHRLFKPVQVRIPALMDLDTQEALALFLEFQGEIPAEMVVAALQDRRKQLFLYLDALYTRDREDCPGELHGQLVHLYADFSPEKLLPFLKSSDHYPIQEALDECELRGMTPERIYLLARMGNTRAALALIIRELSDIEQAVQFCKEHDDSELWNDIINYSLDKPIFINYLLHNIGTHVDPKILVERIEPGLKIPGLRDSLIQILRDFNLQVSLQEGCKKILVSDCYSLLQRKVRTSSKGVLMTEGSTCSMCSGEVMTRDTARIKDVVIFNCRHAFHADCLSDSNVCHVCCQTGKYDSNYTYYYKD